MMCDKCKLYEEKCKIYEEKCELYQQHMSVYEKHIHEIKSVYEKHIEFLTDLNMKIEDTTDSFWKERLLTCWSVAKDIIDNLRTEIKNLKETN